MSTCYYSDNNNNDNNNTFKGRNFIVAMNYALFLPLKRAQGKLQNRLPISHKVQNVTHQGQKRAKQGRNETNSETENQSKFKT